MTQEMILRTLWYEPNDQRIIVNQNELLNFKESLVILGEAGMGKSTLLEWISSQPSYKFCTANQLINRHDPRTIIGDASVLVIDALDERMAKKDGDALDQVLRKLGELGYPRFILSCRVADWRNATAVASINEQYDENPLLLHIEPLSDTDIKKFLSTKFGSDSSDKVIEHFSSKGLNELLGNPQTLTLIADIATNEQLPETKRDIFEKAIEYLAKEHNDKHESQQLDKDSILNFAGAAFASLILAGKDALVRKAATNVSESELLLLDISKLFEVENPDVALNTRLFKGDGADRFSYCHRSIGEYLAARWLAGQANTNRKRRRLLNLFHNYGLVPASLRGVHAWLAIYPEFTNEVITADPTGVLEYGDVDLLSIENARTLLQSLTSLAEEYPYFRNWNTYIARGISKPELVDELKVIIFSQETPFQLRTLFLESIKESSIATNFIKDLRSLVIDPQDIFACRKAASEVLANNDTTENCALLIRTLNSYGDDLSLRLAIEFSDDIHYENLDDKLIIEMAITYAKSNSHTVGVLWNLERNFPSLRLDTFLDFLVTRCNLIDFDHHMGGNDNITDFAFHLICRRLAGNELSAEKLWMWLEPFRSQIGYDQESRKKIDNFFHENISLRRAIQNLVLLDTPSDKNIWQRHYLLRDKSLKLSPTTEDIIVLLGHLDSANQEDNRWREIIQLVPQNGEIGKDVREAATIFAIHNSAALQWLNDLAIPVKAEWEIESERNEEKRIAEYNRLIAEKIEVYREHLEDMKKGHFQWLIDPAKAYLKLFSDINNEAPAHERIAMWLGEEIANAAHQGFELFLFLTPLNPNPEQIIKSFIKGEQWNTGFIFIAALAERFRKNISFDELSDEQLIAGLFHLLRLPVEHEAGIKGLEESIRDSIKQRGLWLSAIKGYIEPQLKARENIDSFESLIRDTEISVVDDLLLEWLTVIPILATNTKIQIIDWLLNSCKKNDLAKIAFVQKDFTDVELKRTWDAVRFITNYEIAITLLEKISIEPELLWHIRGRTSDRYGDNLKVQLSPKQIEWIIKNFRSVWPNEERPDGPTGGDRNSWNASQYLIYLVRHLGNNVDELSVTALNNLKEMPVDGYSETIKSVAAEQRRKRIESIYKPTNIDEIHAVVQDLVPVTVADLQEIVMEELTVAQKMIASNDIDSWKGFFDKDNIPLDEETCSDHLIGILRQHSQEIVYQPETHGANDKEVDITCSVGNLRLPIEVKGQWHKELWNAADSQLDHLYTKDCEADNRGIYLVLWFGKQSNRNKKLKGLGRGKPSPKSPEELRSMLIERSSAARDGRVEIFVMDIVNYKLI